MKTPDQIRTEKIAHIIRRNAATTRVRPQQWAGPLRLAMVAAALAIVIVGLYGVLG